MLIAITAIVAGTGLGWELAWAGRVLFADLAGLKLAAIFPLLAWIGGCVAVVTLALTAAWPNARRLLAESPRALISTQA